jgi:hypothetical protein
MPLPHTTIGLLNTPRAPQRPAFLFVLDVSETALRGGSLRQFRATLAELLRPEGGLPPHALLGLITYDRSLHYHQLPAGERMTHRMLVVTGFGRIVVSEIRAPILRVNLV